MPYIANTKSSTNLIIAHSTHEGRSGKNNEDNYGVFEARFQAGSDPSIVLPIQMVLVADGIGGSASGEIASQIAVETMVKEFEKPVQNVSYQMEKAIRSANREIFIKGQESPAQRGMGTTIVAAAIVNSQLYLAHAGDSRAYLVRNGQIFLLTLDHSWAQEAIDAKYLTLEEAHRHPNKNVIKRFLGPLDHVEVDHTIIEVENRQGNVLQPQFRKLAADNRLALRPGDMLLLCSDGLTDVVSDGQILATLLGHSSQQAVDELINQANAGGGPDNITAILVQIPGPKGAVMPPAPTSSISSAPTEMSPPAGASISAPPKPSKSGIVGNALITLALILATVGLVMVIWPRVNGSIPGIVGPEGDGGATSTTTAEVGNTPIAVALVVTETATVVVIETTIPMPTATTVSVPTETETSTPTETPSPTATTEGEAAVVVPFEETPEAEEEAAAEETPTPTATPSATVEPTDTPRPPTSTPVSRFTPTLMPTSTPTPAPTRTPMPTRNPRLPTTTPTPSPIATFINTTSTAIPTNYSFEMLSPDDGVVLQGGYVEFQWGTNIQLAPGQELEFIVWPISVGKDRWKEEGKSPTGAKPSSPTAPVWTAGVNLKPDAIFTANTTYYWGVALGRRDAQGKFEKLDLLNNATRTFVYQPGDGGSSGGQPTENPCDRDPTLCSP